MMMSASRILVLLDLGFFGVLALLILGRAWFGFLDFRDFLDVLLMGYYMHFLGCLTNVMSATLNGG